MDIQYPLASDTWDSDEIEAINRVVKSNRFSMGKEVEMYEREFADYFSADYAVMVNSGSSANLLAVAALVLSDRHELKKGDEVIVPAVSWATTYTVLQQYGLKLKFVDIDIRSLNIDLEKLQGAVTENTKAIMAVNLLGNPNNFTSLLEICRKNNLILIEDNCESMGAKFNNRYTGTFGVAGTFSTFFSHHMSTMEGGMIVTDDRYLCEIMKSLRAHGWTRNLSETSALYKKADNDFYEMFNFILPGYNVRPIEIEAAIGREQLKKLDKFLKNRRNNGNYFIQKFSTLDNIMIQKPTGDSSFFGFSITLKEKGKRDSLIDTLKREGIECRPVVAGNFTRNPVIQYFDYTIEGTLDSADFLHENGFFVGNHHYDCRSSIDKLFDLIKD